MPCWREAGLARGVAPSAEPEFPVPTRAASLRWLATAGTGWVLRRCTDLLPNLLTPLRFVAAQRWRTATKRSGVPGAAWAAAGRSAARTTPITG